MPETTRRRRKRWVLLVALLVVGYVIAALSFGWARLDTVKQDYGGSASIEMSGVDSARVVVVVDIQVTGGPPDPIASSVTLWAERDGRRYELDSVDGARATFRAADGDLITEWIDWGELMLDNDVVSRPPYLALPIGDQFSTPRFVWWAVRAQAVPAVITVLSVVGVGAIGVQWWRRRRPAGACPGCGYPTRGRRPGRCPECGRRDDMR